MKIEIPSQLQKSSFRFIRVNTKTKRPIDDKWTTKNNYMWNNPILTKWIQKNNYGVCGGFNNLLIIDSDSPESKKYIEKYLPQTFSVKTGSVEEYKIHYYYFCDITPNISLTKLIDGEEKHFADVQGTGAMVVGADCIHPSGCKYVVLNDIPIAKLSIDVLKETIKNLSDTKKISEETSEKIKSKINFQETDIEKQLNVSQIFALEGLTKSGNEYYGSHPIHGSTHGMNFWVNPTKNIWRCFRCNSGGGVANAIAVKEKLIHCSQSGKLDSEIYRKVLKIAKEKYGFVNLEEEIYELSDNAARNKRDELLERISKYKDWVTQDDFLGMLARKIKIKKFVLQKRMKELIEDKTPRESISAFELLKEPFPNIEYYVDPFLPKGQLIFIGGKPGSTKSMFVLDMILKILMHKPFLDHNVLIDKTTKILYYDLEGEKEGAHRRISYLLKGIEENLNTNAFKNLTIPVRKKGSGLLFKSNNLLSEVKYCLNFDIIVLDSYSKFLSGDENKSEITTAFYNNFLAPLVAAKKTIIVIHHLKKYKEEDFSKYDLMSLLRGSSAISADCDIVYLLDKVAETIDDNGLMTQVINFKKTQKNRPGLILRNFVFEVIMDKKNQKTFLKFKTYGSTKKFTVLQTNIKNKVFKILANKNAQRKEIINVLEQYFKDVSKGYFIKILEQMVDNDEISNPKKGVYSLQKSLNLEKNLGEKNE